MDLDVTAGGFCGVVLAGGTDSMINPLGVAGKKVKHHYDIPTDFYRLYRYDV